MAGQPPVLWFYDFVICTMAIDVNKPNFSDYLTKPTPPISSPPHGDYQCNNNQAIRTTTPQDQATNAPPGISDTYNQDDFHTISTSTTQDQAFDSETSNQDAIPSGITIDNWNKMTLEEQYNEQCYNYFDNIDDDAEVFLIDFDLFPSNPTTDTTTHMPTMIKEKSTPPNAADAPIHTDTPIVETEEEQQHTRHTQSKDWPVTVISNKNTNRNKNKKKKKMQKKVTLKMTHMPAIIEEEEEEEEEGLIPSGMFNIDNEFTTSNATEKEEDEKSSNNYYDNIDHEILLPTTTVTNKTKKKQKILLPPELTQAFSFLTNQIGENIVEYVLEMLIEDPADEEDTREIVRGILIEVMLSQCNIDEAVASDCICDIFALFDVLFDASDTTSDIPPTNTNIRPTSKKKKKQKKTAPPKTRSSPNMTHMPTIIKAATCWRLSKRQIHPLPITIFPSLKIPLL